MLDALAVGDADDVDLLVGESAAGGVKAEEITSPMACDGCAASAPARIPAGTFHLSITWAAPAVHRYLLFWG